MAVTCTFTVFSARPSSAAICLLSRPSARHSSTRNCWGVSCARRAASSASASERSDAMGGNQLPPSSTAAMASPMASAGADLGMKPAAPNCCARRITRGWSLDEMMTTGSSGYSPRTCSKAEKPRVPGMLRSSNTSSTSGCSCKACPSVAALAASSVRYWGRRSRSTCNTAARNRGWSSATRSVGSDMGRVCHDTRSICWGSYRDAAGVRGGPSFSGLAAMGIAGEHCSSGLGRFLRKSHWF
jgi:hypothetical protein